MATTTNFGWETPDDTDLVKDGAAAMRTLGNAIDTSLVDLKGGTTGQVLSKASNTDMDFSWVAQDDSNAIQNTIVDAKGDIITATAADTPARLAVGANGYTLVADSSTSTGLAYASSAPVNPVINGGQDIWQRGTSFSTAANTSAYTGDRWQVRTTGANMANTVSRQVTNDSTNLPFIQYCARVQRNSGQTGTAFFIYEQGLESVNSIPFAGRTITLSFYARAGANFSSASSILVSSLPNGTGTDQMPGVYTGGVYPTQNNTLTTTWQRFSHTYTVPSTATELGIQLYYNPVGTAGANDYFEVTGVQIDLGSTALPFRRSGGTLQGELAACQRYYIRYIYSGYANAAMGNGTYYTSADCYVTYPFPVNMRTAPSFNSSRAAALVVLSNGASRTSTAIALGQVTNQFAEINVSAGTATAGHGGFIRTNASTDWLEYSAEL